MEKPFYIQAAPFIVPTEDGKHIEEHFGAAGTGQTDLSIARMIAPPGWGEPPQRPEFDEYTFIIRGKKRIVVEGESIDLLAGQSIKVAKGSRVQYSNPFAEEVEYLSVCLPAFSQERVHREDSV